MAHILCVIISFQKQTEQRLFELLSCKESLQKLLQCIYSTVHWMVTLITLGANARYSVAFL